MTKLLRASERLRDATAPLTVNLGKAAYALNPLVYAWEPHAAFVKRYGRPRVEAIWLGMNPGPWGMMQTGVPFGAIPAVRDYLGIEAPVHAPPHTHPKRPVEGFGTQRVEVSGRRLWGAIEQNMGPAENFFDRYWIVNYCPVVWQSETGANLPPDKLPKQQTAALFEACDAHLVEVTRLLRPKTLIGVGAWAEACARRVAKVHGLDVNVGRVLHPSPASPAANRGWAKAAQQQLHALGHPMVAL